MLAEWTQDHPELARKVLLLSSVRPSFPSLFWGQERQFEAGNILAVHGDKHKSLRAAWQPMFFSGRRVFTITNRENLCSVPQFFSYTRECLLCSLIAVLAVILFGVAELLMHNIEYFRSGLVHAVWSHIPLS